MRSGTSGSEAFAIALGVLLGMVLLVLRATSDGLLEMGDGVNHYMIARYSWRHPQLLLDLWGKPLFTLLASPFAQLGHAGVAGFNAVVAAGTAWCGVLALRSAGVAAQTAFPLLVLLAPQYVLMVMAGMTEPLFGLVTVLAVLLLLNERHAAGAAVASLAPFTRPEHIAFLPLVLGWLLLERRWRAMPWLLLGIGSYMLLTAAFKGDAFWFWTGDPYRHADGVYGSGPLDFFVVNAVEVYGPPLLSLGMAGLLLWPLVHWKDVEQRRAHRLLLVTAALPVLAIVAIHSVLWWTGHRGSAGLLRVLVTTVPLAGLFAAFTLGRGAMLLLRSPRARTITAALLLPVIAGWCAVDLAGRVQLPVRPEMNQHFLDRAARAVKHHRQEGERVYSTHPYIAFGAGLDPFDSTVYNTLWGLSDAEVQQRFRPGDLLAWDAQMGSNEAGLPLQRLLADGRFAVLEALEPPEASRVLGGHEYEIFLFERRDVVRSFTMDTLIWQGHVRDGTGLRADTAPCDEALSGRWCLKEGEFPLEVRGLPLPATGAIYDEWILTARASVSDGSRLAIVFAQRLGDQGVRYDQADVVTGDLLFNRRVPPAAPGTEQVIYFWNMGGRPFRLEGLSLLRKRWTQRPA